MIEIDNYFTATSKIFNPRPKVLFIVSKERKTAKGIGRSSERVAVKHRRRNFPFRKRSLPFLRKFSTKKKDIHNPDSNPGPYVQK